MPSGSAARAPDGASPFMHLAAIDVPPRWQILAPDGVARGGALPIRLVSGPGFGDGKHPTTQLCLQAVAALAPRGRAWRLLDVGSGSAILSIAGALLGASVDAVEVDERAIEHAAVNIQASGVAAQVRQVRTLAQAGARFDLVVANILRPVLLDLAEELVPKREGALVLSGLVSADVPRDERAVRAAPGPAAGDLRGRRVARARVAPLAERAVGRRKLTHDAGADLRESPEAPA